MKPPKHLVLPFLAALFLLPAALYAQNRLVPAENVTRLREIWSKKGKDLTADRYGRNVWGGFDLNGDSIGDFGVYRGSTNQWMFYAGGNPPDTAAMWIFDSLGHQMPTIGRFRNLSQDEVILRSGWYQEIEGHGYYYDRLVVFAIHDTGISATPTVVFDQGTQDPPLERSIRGIHSINIDGDAYDDLVVVISTLRFGHVPTNVERKFQMWFYLGGPDFTLSEPDVIVYDTTRGSSYDVGNWEARFADFDGDGRLDMLCGGGYPEGEMMRFYFGDENSPQSWTERDFDREVVLKHGVHGINNSTTLHIFDADGDGAVDFGSREYGDVYGSRLYLSGSGKSVRTRSFTLEDADRLYENAILTTYPIGFLNDSSRRFEPILLYLVSGGPDAVVVSGGSWGPDYDYDAEHYSGNVSPINRESKGVRDITGDGWDDFIAANETFGSIVPEGRVTIFAGGPYIPFDDPTVSVREEPVAGLDRGLFLWPNPVDDELHIAWRGDLPSMPVRFEVFSSTGESVVSGSIDPLRGEAIWYCADLPNGHYRLVGYDRTDAVITTAPLILQR